MTLSLQVDDQVSVLRDQVRAFVGETVIPAEPRPPGEHGPSEELRRELQQAARAAGVFAPHVPVEYGGLGLDTRGQALIFEEAGRSLLGPLALNCAAPDEANMLLLERVASPGQKQRYLAPLARGEVRSSFAMTEPAPGAGADPGRLQTTARRVAGRWRIDGRKWFITGADGAAFIIVMAATGNGRATMFIIEAGHPGMTVTRIVPSLDSGFVGGHCEVEFNDCQVTDAHILGAEDAGFEYAQVRLAPARLTHCMRWVGLAARAHDYALGYAVDRPMFGTTLAGLGLAQQHIADNEIDLMACRSLIAAAATMLDAGHSAKHETSIAKTFVSEAVFRIVDRSVQLCGSLGVSHDAPLARYLQEVRPFRIYDGPSEAHRWSIARRAVRRATRQSTDDDA